MLDDEAKDLGRLSRPKGKTGQSHVTLRETFGNLDVSVSVVYEGLFPRWTAFLFEFYRISTSFDGTSEHRIARRKVVNNTSVFQHHQSEFLRSTCINGMS